MRLLLSAVVGWLVGIASSTLIGSHSWPHAGSAVYGVELATGFVFACLAMMATRP